jgi:hypothetical protein
VYGVKVCVVAAWFQSGMSCGAKALWGVWQKMQIWSVP